VVKTDLQTGRIKRKDSVFVVKTDKMTGVLDWTGKEIIPLTQKEVNVQLKFNGPNLFKNNRIRCGYMIVMEIT
jgi:hypothetical protein